MRQMQADLVLSLYNVGAVVDAVQARTLLTEALSVRAALSKHPWSIAETTGLLWVTAKIS